MHPLVSKFFSFIKKQNKEAAHLVWLKICDVDHVQVVENIHDDLSKPPENYARTVLQQIIELGAEWNDLAIALIHKINAAALAEPGAASIECDTALHTAVRVGNVELMSHLLNKNSALVDVVNMYGCTPLHYASHKGDADVVNLLLQRGANKEAKAEPTPTFAQTPLYLAAMNNHGKVANILLSNKTNPNNTIKDNQTALHVAAIRNHSDMIGLLYAYGAVLDAKTIDLGATPLHLAIMNFADAAVDMLLELGANPTVKNKAGLNAYDLVLQQMIAISNHEKCSLSFERSAKILQRLESYKAQPKVQFTLFPP